MRAGGDIGRRAGTVEEEAWRWALFAVFAATVARLAWLAPNPVDLYPDEAQYWWWSLSPAFGYYSKPPMIAWLIWATTRLLGEDEFAVRLAAPLLHFATALVVFAIARRLYDARVAGWSAVAYATLPGVSASAILISTDAPLMLCWAVALFAFIRAREGGGARWWGIVAIAGGLGLLSKYAMAYWLLSALLFLALFRDERRHLRPFLAAAMGALVIYSPNFLWNYANGFASYRHTEANASLHGTLFHPDRLIEFFGSQFLVFGPLLFASLIAIAVLARRTLADRRAVLLATFAFPTLAMMLVVSLLSRAQPNWSAPTFISATVLVVAWLLERGRTRVVAASIALHVLAVVAVLEARPIAGAFAFDLPAKYDLLHRLRGWKRLGQIVSVELIRDRGAFLLADDREDMAALLFYVHPHPFDALKWNGDDGLPHDQFDLVAHPERYIGADFLLVAHRSDNERILERFEEAGPVQHAVIPQGGGQAREFTLRLLHGFRGYR